MIGWRKREGERRGFALVELVTVVLIAGTLTRIVVPNVTVMLQRARAAEMLGDVRVVQLAALEYHAQENAWPTTTGRGEAPPVLAPHLPGGFDFERDGYALSWRTWDMPDGLPGREGVVRLVGVTVHTEGEEAGAALYEAAGGEALIIVGGSYTFLLPDSG